MMNTMGHDTPVETNRRSFLKSMATAGGMLLVAGGMPTLGAAASWTRPIGVQLYTLRDRMEEDVEGTLQQVADMGYEEVEFAGYYDHTPQQIRTLLDRYNLSAPSAHVSLDLLRNDLDGQIASARTIGHEYLTVPMLMDAFQGEMTPAQWEQTAGEFNQIGEALRNAGLQFAYHNHHFEFAPAGSDRTGFDVLVQETDPALVSFELDLMWVVVAGHNPVSLIQQYPGRFVMWHVKDIEGIDDAQAAANSAAGMDGFRAIMQRIRAVGEGDIDFSRIFAQADESGLRHIFVENDAPREPISNIQTSYANLTQLMDQ